MKLVAKGLTERDIVVVETGIEPAIGFGPGHFPKIRGRQGQGVAPGMLSGDLIGDLQKFPDIGPIEMLPDIFGNFIPPRYQLKPLIREKAQFMKVEKDQRRFPAV
jgi:hypothetical protein